MIPNTVPRRPPAVRGRRQILSAAGAAALLTMSGVGCTDGALSTDPDEPGVDNGGGGNGEEAPELAKLVKSGDLPKVQDRLPENPLVVGPVDRLGTYGGEWRTMITGVADGPWIKRTINYEHLLTWDREFTEIQPNLAESYEANDEGTEYTFTLRKGVRWSDGEPFTADDITFAYDDIRNDPDIISPTPGWLSSGAKAGKKPATLEKLDDYTVRFTFDEPNGLFLTYVTELAGGDLTGFPRHHLEQFHKKYTPDVDKLAEEEGFADWVELFWARSERWQNVGVPTLTAWMTEQALGDGDRFVVTRNPYYWKTDPDGSQLPYLDRVVYDVVSENEVMILKISNGEIDMHCRHVNIPANKPVLARSREDGDYDFFEIRTTDTNQMAIHLNLTNPDPVLSEVFQNKEFRIGLSHAINRQEIIDAVFQRQGEPWQVAPRPESPFYDEEYAQQYLEYDPDLANQILDDAGFEQRDEDGIRLRPDGKPIAFTVEIAVPSLTAGWVPAMELVTDYWSEVGIDARIKSEDRSLFWEKMISSQHEASVWLGEFGDIDAVLFSAAYMPARGDSQFAVNWGKWYETDGEEGTEPPPEVIRQFEIFDEAKAAVDDSARVELFREALAISRDQFYNIGVALPTNGYGIVKNTFHNVPKSMPGSFPYPTPAPTRPEQYFRTA